MGEGVCLFGHIANNGLGGSSNNVDAQIFWWKTLKDISKILWPHGQVGLNWTEFYFDTLTESCDHTQWNHWKHCKRASLIYCRGQVKFILPWNTPNAQVGNSEKTNWSSKSTIPRMNITAKALNWNGHTALNASMTLLQ